MRPGSIVAVLTALLIVPSACAPPQAGAPDSRSNQPTTTAAPKRLTAAIRGDPKVLYDPINAAAGGSSTAGVREIEILLNAGLLILDASGEMQPQLAEAVPTIQNGAWKLLPDGRMETTWKLRQNLRWHDGTPLTVDDFLFTATVARDRSIPMSVGEAYQFLDTVEAPDSQTLRATWRSTFAHADKLFSAGPGNNVLVLPKHLLESTYLDDRANFTGSPALGPQFVGAGPYRLKDWVLGSHLVLEANDGYVLGRPKIDQIEVKFILDTITLVSNVLAGAVHVTLGRGLTPEQAITARDQWKEGVVDAGLQNTTSLYPQLLDSDPPLLTDVRFRRALLHALDRQQMVDFFLAGLVPVAHSIISPDDPEFRTVQPSLVRYAHDPRRAMELLESMGLSKGPDGFYVNPSTGGRITIEVRTRAHPLREQVQQVIADEWARVGLVGQALVVPEQRINDRVYQSTFPGFYFRFGGPQQITNWQTRMAPVAENNYVGSNTMRYRNPEYDTLIERYVSTIPQAERLSLLSQIVQHTTDQLVPIPLYHEPEPVLISNRLINASGRRGQSVQTWNVHEWDMRQ